MKEPKEIMKEPKKHPTPKHGRFEEIVNMLSEKLFVKKGKKEPKDDDEEMEVSKKDKPKLFGKNK